MYELKKAFGPGRYVGVFITVSALLFFAPFLQRGPILQLALDFFLALVFLSSILAVVRRRMVVAFATATAAIGFGGALLLHAVKIPEMALISNGATAVFFMITATTIFKHVLKAREVDSDTIWAALCVYLFLGLMWAFLYATLETLHPGSFKIPEDFYQTSPGGRSVVGAAGFIYYSFVTMTTLGYGDMTPLSPAARSFSSFQAIMGQLYLTVLVARLVGLHIMSHTQSDSRRKEDPLPESRRENGRRNT